MYLPGRHESIDPDRYRYGFNGMEGDDEVKGKRNSYTTEFRQYDPRLGRWKSVDPKSGKYPELTPYQGFNNNPVFFTDPFGDEPPERLGFWARIGNWLKGKGHKNRANKKAVKDNSDLYSTMNGDIQIVVDKETRIATSFVAKELRDDWLLRQLGESSTVEFNIEYMRPQQMLYNMIQDSGGFVNSIIINPLDQLESVNVGTLTTTIFYDDVRGTDTDDPLVAQISITTSNIAEARFRLKFGSLSGARNSVYMRMKKMPNGQILPYIGKSFDVVSRYTKAIRSSSRLKTIVSNITDKDMLRAVEQRMINYVKSKTKNVANVRDAMNEKDYKKYKHAVDDILKGSEWQKYIDDYFGF